MITTLLLIGQNNEKRNGDNKNWKSKKETRPSRLENCWDQIENWKESLGDRSKLAVTQTQVKAHQLTLV